MDRGGDRAEASTDGDAGSLGQPPFKTTIK